MFHHQCSVSSSCCIVLLLLVYNLFVKFVCKRLIFSIFLSLPFVLSLVSICIAKEAKANYNDIDKRNLRMQAKEMFMHGYNSYMKYAYPHDELMPLSCKGRVKGVTPSRGDIDDALGNFSLTLVDSLDTLVVVGELNEFENAVKLVINNVRFDSNVVVSVFETNIRMVGGLISAHILTKLVQSKNYQMAWYDDQLLKMATNLADRLLPAFNTTSGLPYSRINLRYGMLDFLKEQKDTCTACGGTMILEFAALSRLTGISIYEEKARKAMDFLWSQRHRGSDLMGTVLNVHSGDWIRRDAGIGAGIDSYYEYCLKAFVLFGDYDYLDRFNTHYEAIMRYVNKGPLFIDVHMHKPSVASRNFMDALLAFWPGLQVLKGDLNSAIQFHEMLYQVIKLHRFLPEAFTHDLQVHWAQHPIRPEFVESTYLLYRATRDTYYLDVAKNVMNSINDFLRVDCGFAAVKDIRDMTFEDRMDSFVLSETLKYLYMIYAEPSDMIFDPDNFVFTTEAHFIPLNIGSSNESKQHSRRVFVPDELIDQSEFDSYLKKFRSACPNVLYETSTHLATYAHSLRLRVHSVVDHLRKLSSDVESTSQSCSDQSHNAERLRLWMFSSANADHMQQLKQMGIETQVDPDGRMQFTHSSAKGGAGHDYKRCMKGASISGKKSFRSSQSVLSLSHSSATQMLTMVLFIVLAWLAVLIMSGFLFFLAALLYKIVNRNRNFISNSNTGC